MTSYVLSSYLNSEYTFIWEIPYYSSNITISKRESINCIKGINWNHLRYEFIWINQDLILTTAINFDVETRCNLAQSIFGYEQRY